MVSTNISFTKEKNGYDRQQVDNYIKKLSEAYQTTYYEYLDISGKYKSLLEESEKQDKQEQVELSPDVIAKTLINTEMLAQKIIADAQAEATAVLAEARKSLSNSKEETAKAKEAAKKIIDDANEEAEMAAARARESFEKAQKVMKQAAYEVEELLAFRTKDIQGTQELAEAA